MNLERHADPPTMVVMKNAGDYKKRSDTIHSQSVFHFVAENCYMNLPIGFNFPADQYNTELLRILTPNMLRMGRINSRSIQGPVNLPVNKKGLLEHVENVYKGWFNLFKDTVVPRLIRQPKWFKIDRDLKEKDIVYFQKR